MTYFPMRSPFVLPMDHPDHPYQHLLRGKAAEKESPAELAEAQEAAKAIAEDEDEQPVADEDCLCEHLTYLAAYTHQLQMQAHLLHFAYRGANFLSIHKFLKKAYERHLEEFDSLLEAVQMLGRETPATHEELLKILPAFEHAMSTCDCQLSNYRENLLQQRKWCQEIEQEAQDAREIGVADLLATIDTAAAKDAWFIAATLKQP